MKGADLPQRARPKAVIWLFLCAVIPCARAAEFEVLDKLSVDGYTVLRGSADIPGGSFAVGASTFAVKDGKAGFGIASPAAQLHLFRREDAGAAAGMPEIRLEHQDIRAVGVGGSNGGRFNFYNIQRDNTAWAADSVWGEIGFYPSQPTAGAAQIGAKILAAADGSIGGTQTSSYLSFQTTSGSALAERLRVNSAGNVGINTTAPGARLEVNGTALFGSDMFTYQNGGIFFSGNGLYGSGIYGRNSGNDLVFNSGGAEKMRILTGGNVGCAKSNLSRRVGENPKQGKTSNHPETELRMTVGNESHEAGGKKRTG